MNWKFWKTKPKVTPDVLLIGENKALMRFSFVLGGRRFVREYDSLDYVTELKEDGTTSGEQSQKFPRWEAIK